MYPALKSTKQYPSRYFLILWFEDFGYFGFDFGELFAAIGEELGCCFYFCCQLVDGELSALDF